jgi:hypothetical protein
MAMVARRFDLLDTPVLAGLAKAINTRYGAQYEQVFRWVVHNLSTDEMLPTLDDPGPRYLLQMLLSRRAYADLNAELVRHARLLYAADKQADYAVMVRRLFAETPIEPENVGVALAAMQAGGMRTLPLIMAHLGALKRNGWPPILEPIASDVTQLLINNRKLTEAIPPASLMELLDFHTKREDEANTVRVAGLLPALAARRGESGAAAMAQMYRAMTWGEKPRIAGLEILRRYVRMVDPAFAAQAVARLREGLGEPVGRALEATLAFRGLMAGQDITVFAEQIHEVAEFLHITALVYADRKRLPTLRVLLSDMDSLIGGLSDDDRREIARGVLNVGRVIVTLGKAQPSVRPRDRDTYLNNLLALKATPQTGLDVLRVMGGYFAKGRRLNEEFTAPASLHPLGDRTAPALLRDLSAVTVFLRGVLKAFPVEKPVGLSPEAISGELESLWGDVPLDVQRKLVRDLAADLQRIPELVLMITERGNPRVLEEADGTGRKLDSNRIQPQNTLEFYRFVHGYFKARTRE